MVLSKNAGLVPKERSTDSDTDSITLNKQLTNSLNQLCERFMFVWLQVNFSLDIQELHHNLSLFRLDLCLLFKYPWKVFYLTTFLQTLRLWQPFEYTQGRTTVNNQTQGLIFN